jgi:hypothetical protein
VRLAWDRLKKKGNIKDLHFHELRYEAISRFFNENFKTFKKIIPYRYEELGLKFFERSIEYKKKIESWKSRPIGSFS